jgi:hypothetical protein
MTVQSIAKLAGFAALVALAGCTKPYRADPLNEAVLRMSQRSCAAGSEVGCAQIARLQHKVDAERAGQPWESEDPDHPYNSPGPTASGPRTWYGSTVSGTFYGTSGPYGGGTSRFFSGGFRGYGR